MITLNLGYMATLSIALLSGVFAYKYLNRELKIVWFLIIVTFIIEWIGFYNLHISENKKVDTRLYLYFGPFEFSMLTIYFLCLIKQSWFRNFTILFGISIIGIFIIDFQKSKGLIISNYKYFILPISYYIFYSIVFLNQLLNSNVEIANNPNYWIVTGILFFYAGFFFISGFINYVAERDLLLAKKLFSINHILNIIYYSLITYGFICQRRLAKSSL